MKLYKLWVHQRTFSEEELVINPRDFPNLSSGDVLEIYHPEDEACHLLLRVKSLHADFQQKDTISIDQSIATTFQLRPYLDVCVNKVSDDHGVLDMAEFTSKDQYLNGSDMWRLRQSLVGSCVYLSKKIQFSGMRVQVNEMWVQGEKVICGRIGKSTKVLFRSQSAQIHLFLQMSAEMWEFDFFGDLYFERATNGFLSELFTQWRDKNCTHEVTIILFSRTYYEAKSLDEFPADMQRNIVRSVDGLFYQDFFKVITVAEKCDDWKHVIIQLKSNFTKYRKSVFCTKGTSPSTCPQGWNSRACEGNILEAVNISLNIFERHFIDCNLELTNWSMVLVTPGQGVFNVCRELTSLTKQRVMDSGVGIDLVCLAEQPLHAAPLFKFLKERSETGETINVPDEYYIPPWINYSFYALPEQVKHYNGFIPRMKIPEKPILSDASSKRHSNVKTIENIDYDKYDSLIFQSDLPRLSSDCRHKPGTRKKSELELGHHHRFSPENSVKVLTGNSHDFLHQKSSENKQSSTSLLAAPNDTSTIGMKTSLSTPDMPRTGSDDNSFSKHIDRDSAHHTQSPQDYGAVNPFKPHSYSYKITLFRHRWQHVFPTGPKGETVQEHHKMISGSELQSLSKSPLVESEEAAAAIGRQNVLSGASGSTEMDEMDGTSEADSLSIKTTSEHGYDDIAPKAARRATQTQIDWKGNVKTDEWSDPFYQCSAGQDNETTIMTSVDWKSLTVPASLPLSTDYFPDKRTLDNDYVEYNYTLIIDDSVQVDSANVDDNQYGRSKMSAKQKFSEIVSQRLAQGFQLVTNKERLKIILASSERSRHTLKFSPETSARDEHVLSLGHNIHHVQLCGIEVHVNKYAARHIPYSKPVDYWYSLWPQTFNEFVTATTSFSYEGLAKYNWNYLDQYLTSAEGEFNQLSDDLRYWRGRFVLLPVKKQTSNLSFSEEEEMTLIEGFLRFVEGVNRIRRPTIHRRLFSTRKLHESMDSKEKRRPASDQNRVNKRVERPDRGIKEKVSDDQPPAGTPKVAPKPEDAPKVTVSTPEAESSEKSKFSDTYGDPGSQKSPARPESDVDKAAVDTQKSDEAQDCKTPTKTEGEKGKIESRTKEQLKREGPKLDINVNVKRKDGKDGAGSTEANKKDKDKKSLPASEESPKSSQQNDADTKKTVLTPSADVSMNPSKMPPEHALSSTSSLEEIVRVMQNPEYGLSFIPEQPQIRLWTFISAEAVAWMIKSIDGIDTKTDAVAIGQKLCDAGSIVHVSGSSKQEFKDGFVLYYINSPEIVKTKGKKGDEETCKTYSTQWVEVSVWRDKTPCDLCTFLQPDHILEHYDSDVSGQVSSDCSAIYKNIDMKVDPMHKSDRPEWCMAFYHGNFFPKHAFSIELQWMVATGSIVSDLVQGWARKGSSCGLHLVPAPVTPFPTLNNNGKRNPILKSHYIPLAVDSIPIHDRRHIFDEFDKSSWDKRMFLLQETILFKFGFLKDTPKSSLDCGWNFSQRVFETSHFYIHCTGSILVKTDVHKDSTLVSPSSSRPSSASFAKNERELFTYRQSTTRAKISVNRIDFEDPNEDKNGIGFHCIFNHALTRKWRSNITGDQEASSRLLSDFRDFCLNKNSMLVEFWNEEYDKYLSLKEKSPQKAEL